MATASKSTTRRPRQKTAEPKVTFTAMNDFAPASPCDIAVSVRRTLTTLFSPVPNAGGPHRQLAATVKAPSEAP